MGIFNWLRGGPKTVQAYRVDGSGSHSWDASFRCRSNYYCSCEVYAYDVERLPNGAGLRWRCPCGTFRALSPQQVSDMRKQLVDDAAAPDGTR